MELLSAAEIARKRVEMCLLLVMFKLLFFVVIVNIIITLLPVTLLVCFSREV